MKGLFTETASILKAMDMESATERARNQGGVELVEAAMALLPARAIPSRRLRTLREQIGVKPCRSGTEAQVRFPGPNSLAMLPGRPITRLIAQSSKTRCAGWGFSDGDGGDGEDVLYESRLSCQPSGAHDDTVATGLSQSRSIISITSIISLHVHLGSDGLIACFICGPAPATPITSERRKNGDFLNLNKPESPAVDNGCMHIPTRPALSVSCVQGRHGQDAYGHKRGGRRHQLVWVNMAKAPK